LIALAWLQFASRLVRKLARSMLGFGRCFFDPVTHGLDGALGCVRRLDSDVLRVVS